MKEMLKFAGVIFYYGIGLQKKVGLAKFLSGEKIAPRRN